MQRYEPVPLLAARCAKLWRGAMDLPQYNQLSPEERRSGSSAVMGEMLGLAMVAEAREKTTDAQLDAFQIALKEILAGEATVDSLLAAAECLGEDPGQSELEAVIRLAARSGWLHVDYGADMILRTACKVAGVSECLLPIKSTSGISYPDSFPHVHVSFGYGVTPEFHYPLDDAGELWFVTTLSGTRTDTAKLLDVVRNSDETTRDLLPGRIDETGIL